MASLTSRDLPFGLSARTGWLLVFAVAFTLYAATASRGVQWGDSTQIMYRVVNQEVVHYAGLALSHPLHHWLSRAAVFIGGSNPSAMTLVSALAGALAVASVFGCVQSLTRLPAAALFAAASLALATTFWRMSTLVEVYTVGAALLAGTCWCIVRYAQGAGKWALWLACLLNGLGGANDLQSGLTTPVLMAVVAYEWRLRRIGLADASIAAGAWLVGIMPYGTLVIAELLASGDLRATLRSALFGNLWTDEVLNAGISLRVLMIDVGYPLLNFPNLLLPAAVYGMMRARDLDVPALARASLIAILVLQSVFALRYNIDEQYNFFLPTYVLLAIFGGVGAAAVMRSAGRRWLIRAAFILLAATPLTYVAVTMVARHFNVLGEFLRNKPYRDDYVYLIIPWSVSERSAEQMSRQVLRLAGADGVIVLEDWMPYWILHYSAMLEGRGKPTTVWWQAPDARTLIDEAVTHARPVVLIPRNRDRPQALPPAGGWRREGDVYVLERRS